jgi:hypothetical protein
MGDPGFEPGTSSLSGARGSGFAWVVSGFRLHLYGSASPTRTAAGVIRAAEASTKLPETTLCGGRGADMRSVRAAP